LTEAIRKAENLPADAIITLLYSAVLQFANGTKQQKDLTAVIAARETARGSGSSWWDLSHSGVHGDVHNPSTVEHSS
jgi:hypothetical protein